jgi:hypothetical protein
MSEKNEGHLFVDGAADTDMRDALIGLARERLRGSGFIPFTGLDGLSGVVTQNDDPASSEQRKTPVRGYNHLR